MEIEQAFSMSIPDADAERIETVQQLVDYVIEHHRSSGSRFAGAFGERGSIDPQFIANEVRRIVAKQTNLPIERVTMHSHFINDLNMD